MLRKQRFFKNKQIRRIQKRNPVGKKKDLSLFKIYQKKYETILNIPT